MTPLPACDRCGDSIHSEAEAWHCEWPTPNPSGVVCQECWEWICGQAWWAVMGAEVSDDGA